jgi:hypothetical protein
MAKNIDQIAKKLGATRIAEIPETGGGAFGAARLFHIVQQLRSRIIPGRGRPTESNWVQHPKVPMSDTTKRRLTRLAMKASTADRKISPMQVAAQILEDAVASIPDEPKH